MLIRHFKISDVPQILPLMKQLGYPTTEDQFQQRMATIRLRHNSKSLVGKHKTFWLLI